MIPIQQHIDALDKMVADHATVAETRSQIAFIAREVAVLEASCSELAFANEANAKVIAERDAKIYELEQGYAALQKKNQDAGWDAINKQAENYRKMIRSKQLNYDV